MSVRKFSLSQLAKCVKSNEWNWNNGHSDFKRLFFFHYFYLFIFAKHNRDKIITFKQNVNLIHKQAASEYDYNFIISQLYSTQVLKITDIFLVQHDQVHRHSKKKCLWWYLDAIKTHSICGFGDICTAQFNMVHPHLSRHCRTRRDEWMILKSHLLKCYFMPFWMILINKSIRNWISSI